MKWLSQRFPHLGRQLLDLAKQHLKLRDEPLHLAVAYDPGRDSQDIFLFELLENFGGTSRLKSGVPQGCERFQGKCDLTLRLELLPGKPQRPGHPPGQETARENRCDDHPTADPPPALRSDPRHASSSSQRRCSSAHPVERAAAGRVPFFFFAICTTTGTRASVCFTSEVTVAGRYCAAIRCWPRVYGAVASSCR